MRVFVTGASGFIGSAVVQELIKAGHSVTALARSQESATALSAKGVRPYPGSLDDLASLRTAALDADGVIHLAYMHALGQIPISQRLRVFFGGLPTGIISRVMAVTSEADRRAIDTIGTALKGSGRPLVTTFGTLGLSHPGFRASKLATEDDEPDPRSAGYARAKTEENVEALASMGVRATIIRLPPSVHGAGDTGFVPMLIGIARKKGHAAYIGEGRNRWPAVNRRDAALLFRLALEKGVAGTRYHGIGEEAIPFRSIAERISQNLKVTSGPISEKEGPKWFSFLSGFVATDNPSSGSSTRKQLGWEPTGSGLLEDLDNEGYFTRG